MASDEEPLARVCHGGREFMLTDIPELSHWSAVAAVPAAFKKSLEDRLRARARTGGGDLQRLRQLVVYDRFLARIFDGPLLDLVLKGGLALELRCERARATKDVDLWMRGSPDESLDRLQTAGRLDLGDFLRFEVAIDPKHPTIEADGLAYDGRRFRVQEMLAGRPYGTMRCRTREARDDDGPPRS
jgi:hypothetical protein